MIYTKASAKGVYLVAKPGWFQIKFIEFKERSLVSKKSLDWLTFKETVASWAKGSQRLVLVFKKRNIWKEQAFCHLWKSCTKEKTSKKHALSFCPFFSFHMFLFSLKSFFEAAFINVWIVFYPFLYKKIKDPSNSFWDYKWSKDGPKSTDYLTLFLLLL